MSHFTVLCIVSDNSPEALERLLAPYDENLPVVKPYRDPIDRSDLDRAIEFYTEHPEHAPGLTIGELVRASEDDAIALKVLSAYVSDEVYLADDGTFYRMSTYNPDSKWDYWRVGGRWSGALLLKETANLYDIATPVAHWDAPEDIPEGRADGAYKRDVDIDGMRDAARVTAEINWDTVHDALEGTAPATPWSEYVRRCRDGELSVDEARQLYHAQERVKGFVQVKSGLFASLDEYDVPRELFVRRAVAAAIPGYATLSRTHGWLEPGRMGWFGMSSDTAASRDDYHAQANKLIDDAPDDAFLVYVDCHI